MEPNVNPLVPDSSEPTASNKPTSPYRPSEPGAATPNQFGNSTFKSRTISPLEPAEPQPAVVQAQPPVAPLQPATAPVAQPAPLPEMPATPPTTAAFVGSDNTLPPSNNVFTPQVPNEPGPKSKFSFRTKPVIATVAVLVIGLGFAAYYFGYKNNPSVIYSQSLSNTAKGYDKLVEYVDQQTSAKYNGTVGSGTFKIKSEGVSTDGNIAFKTDDNNGEFSMDVGLVGTRLTLDSRLFENSSGTPDVYIKAGGIKGLGTMAGFPALDASLAKIDDSWILIDHTLIDSFSSNQDDANSIKPPSQAQILDEVQAFGRVNKEYLLSANQDKAVFAVTNNIGFEEVDGHNTYHYQVAVQKENLKAYIDAQKAALKASKLNSWLKQNGYEDAVQTSFDELKKSADSIKLSDKIDVWADVDQRIIYKVRFSDDKNAANNYVDLGLDYKGGDNFPFFIATQNKDDGAETKFKAIINLNTATNEINLKMDASTSGSNDMTLALDVDMKSSDKAIKIEKPANAKTVAQVLSKLGYGEVLNQLKAANTPQTLTD